MCLPPIQNVRPVGSVSPLLQNTEERYLLKSQGIKELLYVCRWGEPQLRMWHLGSRETGSESQLFPS